MRTSRMGTAVSREEEGEKKEEAKGSVKKDTRSSSPLATGAEQAKQIELLNTKRSEGRPSARHDIPKTSLGLANQLLSCSGGQTFLSVAG